MLPGDAHKRAESFTRMSPGAKQQLLVSLQTLSPDQQERAVKQLLKTDSVEAEFLSHVMAKEFSGPNPSPFNKQRGPTHTK
jgi:hypothetical protein